MATIDFTTKASGISHLNADFIDFNLHLGRSLFSDPINTRNGAVVMLNHPEPDLGMNAGELVLIDFTVNEIHSDGLYVITLDDDWIGFRRFQLMPNLNTIDRDGAHVVPASMKAAMKVVGLVTNIYRSTRYN